MMTEKNLLKTLENESPVVPSEDYDELITQLIRSSQQIKKPISIIVKGGV